MDYETARQFNRHVKMSGMGHPDLPDHPYAITHGFSKGDAIKGLILYFAFFGVVISLAMCAAVLASLAFFGG